MPTPPFPDAPDGEPVALSPAVYRRIVRMLTALANPSVSGANYFSVDGDGRMSLIVDGGASIPQPTRRYQVFTPLDDTLTPIWTTARFTDEVTDPPADAAEDDSGT